MLEFTIEVNIMITAHISEKGQITLPVRARKMLGIKPGSRVEIEVRYDELAIKPLKSISEVAGVFKEYAKGKTSDWEEIRKLTERAVSMEIADE